MDLGYCRDITDNSLPMLSARDITGAQSVYGQGDLPFCNDGCATARYSGQHGIRFENGWYLQPRSDGTVMTQDFVGTWERVTFEKVSGSTTGSLHFGDVVGIKDRWGRYLSGRSGNEVGTQTYRGNWERWVIERPSGSGSTSDGAAVLINEPIVLRNLSWNSYLYIRSGRDVEMKSTSNGAQLRIHGRFVNR